MQDPNSLILQKKILFIDEPFADNYSLRGSRSRFLWSIVSAHYDADLLLLKSAVYKEIPVPEHTGFDKQYSLSLESEKVLSPDSYHKLAKGQNERFIGILDSKRYELVVLAVLACLPLAHTIGKTLAQCTIILDIDSNYLPVLESAWQANKKPENAKALWSLMRQKTWDHFLFSSRNYYLFANPSDLKQFSALYKLGAQKTLFLPMPIDITVEGAESATPSEAKSILFWGESANPANLIAARDIVSSIYPRISKKLVEKNINIVLCGGEELQTLCGGRIIFAPITELKDVLHQALFVLLPLTETDSEGRILQTAQAGKPLICSPETVLTWQIPEECYLAESGSDAMGNRIIEVLRGPKQLELAAQNLQQYCLGSFSPEGIKTSLLNAISSWMGEQ